MGKTHKAGQEGVGSTFIFTPVSITPEELVNKIFGRLPYPVQSSPEPSGYLKVYTYKEEPSGDFIVIYGGSGVELGPGLVSGVCWKVRVEAVENSVNCSVAEAHMNSGLVPGAKLLVTVQQEIVDAAKSLDSQVKVEKSVEKVNWN